MYRALFALAALAALVGGCADTSTFTGEDAGTGSGTGVTDLKGLEKIRIEPVDAVLELTSDKPVKQAYRAFGTFRGQSGEREITSLVSFSARDPRLGVFKGAEFVSGVTRGGKTEVEVEGGTTGVTATTTLTLLYKRRYITGGAPSDVAKRFEDAAKGVQTSAPELVYPPDGVLLPPNLVELEFQFKAGDVNNKYYEVSLKNAGTDIRIYTTCKTVGSGCGLQPEPALWNAIVSTLRGADAAEVRVRAIDDKSTSIGVSAARQLLIAEEDIQGGLYYWNATPGSIIRYEFGKPKQAATVFYNAQDAKALTCVGCHALSRDGKRMAVGLDMPAPAPLKVLDVASRTQVSSGAANFMTFSPDGKKILTSDGNTLVLRDSDTLKAIGKDPLVANGTMPDWSADGARVVFAAAGVTLPIPFGRPGIDKGSLRMLAYDAAKGTWAGPIDLVKSGGENNYYPTFSPDNAFVVFNRSSGSSYDAADARLWLIRSNGNGKPVELKRANDRGDLGNSWPKFSPFVQKYRGRRLMWVTFSSRRDYGHRLVGKKRAQIWMAAIEPYRDDLGGDPSYPAFWLPVQDIKTGNHIAQWTEKVVKKPCKDNTDCPGEFCQKGFCEPAVQ